MSHKPGVFVQNELYKKDQEVDYDKYSRKKGPRREKPTVLTKENGKKKIQQLKPMCEEFNDRPVLIDVSNFKGFSDEESESNQSQQKEQEISEGHQEVENESPMSTQAQLKKHNILLNFQDSSESESQQEVQKRNTHIKAIRASNKGQPRQEEPKQESNAHSYKQEQPQYGNDFGTIKHQRSILEHQQGSNCGSHESLEVEKSEDQQMSSKQLPNAVLFNFDDQEEEEEVEELEQEQEESGQKIEQPENVKLFLDELSDESGGQEIENIDIFEVIKPIGVIDLLKSHGANFASKPIPKSRCFQCIVKRDTSSSDGLHYYIYDMGIKRKILSTKKNGNTHVIWINFKDILSTDHCNSVGNISTMPNKVVAKLSSNLIGTEFKCTGMDDKGATEKLLKVEYDINILGLSGPRKMSVFIPEEDCKITKRQLNQVYDSQVKKQSHTVLKFVNKSPKWNNSISAFVLNFHGRAGHSSVKNFIVTKQEDCEKDKSIGYSSIHVLFGKIAKDTFNLDIKYPFTIIQGVALAISSFDRKLLCQ